MAFQERRHRREHGSSMLSSYRFFWGGAEWQTLLTAASSLSKAMQSGVAADIAGDQHDGPGVYELAIACKKSPQKRVKVYISAASNLRGDISALVRDGGMLRGFLDHALKEGHVVWLRCKPTKDTATAAAAADKILAAHDFAWVVQNVGRARSLVIRQNFSCCGLIKTGLDVTEGTPKFVQPGSGRGLMQLLTGSRKR